MCGSILGFLSPLALRVILQRVNSSADDSGSDGNSSASSDGGGSNDNAALSFLSFDVKWAIAILFFSPILGSLANGQNYQRGRRIAIRVGDKGYPTPTQPPPLSISYTHHTPTTHCHTPTVTPTNPPV